MIGGDDLEVIAFQAVPEFFLMPLLAQGWSENIFRAFESGSVEVLD